MGDFIKIALQPATRDDFINGSLPMFGELFYLKSQQSGEFMGPYHLKTDKYNLDQFKNHLEAGMVWREKNRI